MKKFVNRLFNEYCVNFENKWIGLLVFMSFTILFVLLLSYITPDRKPPTEGIPHNYWIPTVEDIAYQDSMYKIIQQTQAEVDTIRESMQHIIYKLDRLTYPDGTWDSIRYKQGGAIDRHLNPDDFDNTIDMDCGDTLEVKATMYHPVEAQCDSDPLITADGSVIDPYCVSDWNWIAVSRDLLVSGGGCFNYGDSVYVVAGHKTGWYTIHDAMHKRKRMQIDFLESIGTSVYRYTEAELIVNT